MQQPHLREVVKNVVVGGEEKADWHRRRQTQRQRMEPPVVGGGSGSGSSSSGSSSSSSDSDEDEDDQEEEGGEEEGTYTRKMQNRMNPLLQKAREAEMQTSSWMDDNEPLTVATFATHPQGKGGFELLTLTRPSPSSHPGPVPPSAGRLSREQVCEDLKNFHTEYHDKMRLWGEGGKTEPLLLNMDLDINLSPPPTPPPASCSKVRSRKLEEDSSRSFNIMLVQPTTCGGGFGWSLNMTALELGGQILHVRLIMESSRPYQPDAMRPGWEFSSILAALEQEHITYGMTMLQLMRFAERAENIVVGKFGPQGLKLIKSRRDWLGSAGFHRQLQEYLSKLHPLVRR